MAESKKKPIEQYTHKDKERVNNPPAGLVTPGTDGVPTKKNYQYDPHLDPQLNWAGKAEHASFEVPTVSLHVHERIDAKTVIEGIRKTAVKTTESSQMSLFESPVENPPIQEAIEFYKHKHNWSNRLVAGDSLLVMNSLLEKEGMSGKVQMVYFDPPYGIKYGSNFQPFTNKRDVKDGNDEDLTAEPEMLKAFRDTWELGIHSYLTYLRDRFLLARELLTESGSMFLQISDENVHLVRNVMDEVFGSENFVSLITFRKTTGVQSNFVAGVSDYILWYGKNKAKGKFRPLFKEKDIDENYRFYMNKSPNQFEPITDILIKKNGINDVKSKAFRFDHLLSTGPSTKDQSFKYEGKVYQPPANNHWKTNIDGMNVLTGKGRIFSNGKSLSYIRYLNDFPMFPYSNFWEDTTTGGSGEKIYVVQTTTKVIERCLLMTTDPGDLVFDPTCGSGTTASVAEQWGRRWITCDTSRVAITLAKQRLLTSVFDYYELLSPADGVGSGFKYKTVPHITLGSIANNEPPAQETLFDKPFIDNSKARVTGPFTVEAVPAPSVRSIDEAKATRPDDVMRHAKSKDIVVDSSIVRSGDTLRHEEWRKELLASGIRGKGGEKTQFSRVEAFSVTNYLSADAETSKGERAVVSFGPEHAPLGKVQVSRAIEEAETLVPKPKLIVFCAFSFDPEAAKSIDEIKWPGVNLLKVQMNADLITDDLKKKRSSNESFWYIGQPDVELKKIPLPPLQKGVKDKKGKQSSQKYCFQVDVNGFDYFNTKTNEIESGDKSHIVLWMLDTDYDGRSIFPSQIFLPLAGEKEGWKKLAKNLKAEIDEELIESYRSYTSLPFSAGDHKRIAVKIVDNRGIESLKVVELK